MENMSAVSCFYFSQLESSAYKMLFTYNISYTTLGIKHHTTFANEESRKMKQLNGILLQYQIQDLYLQIVYLLH